MKSGTQIPTFQGTSCLYLSRGEEMWENKGTAQGKDEGNGTINRQIRDGDL